MNNIYNNKQNLFIEFEYHSSNYMIFYNFNLTVDSYDYPKLIGVLILKKIICELSNMQHRGNNILYN